MSDDLQPSALHIVSSIDTFGINFPFSILDIIDAGILFPPTCF